MSRVSISVIDLTMLFLSLDREPVVFFFFFFLVMNLVALESFRGQTYFLWLTI